MSKALIDLDYQIGDYKWKGRPIGGKLKSNPTDFIVIELDGEHRVDQVEYQDSDGGLYLVGMVWKRKIDHSQMIKTLSKTFQVREEDISTGGIKDAYAETTQLFSVFQPRKIPPDPLQPLNNMEISNYRYAREKVFPGSMGGNYFEITIRDCDYINTEELENFGNWAETGIINYFGYQRFGSSRPISAMMGRLILQRKYKDAIDLYLGGISDEFDDKFRQLWRDTKDPQFMLDNWISIPIIEKEILKYLVRRNNDFSGAVKKFPLFLQRIFTSAFISLLANHYLRLRGLDEIVNKGERKIGNNIEIALPSKEWRSPLNEVWAEVFSQNNIDITTEFKTIKHTSRMLKAFVKEWKIDAIMDQDVTISFKLGVGNYATTVLRELMKSPPYAYFR